MPERSSVLGSVVSCVPQVYFDFIGRIIPGMVVLGTLVCVFQLGGSPEVLGAILKGALQLTTGAAVLVLIVMSVLSYVYAVLLWRPGYWIASSIPGGRGKWDNPRFCRDYEKLRRNDPRAGERITKLKAQVHMSEVILAGFVLSILIGDRTVDRRPSAVVHVSFGHLGCMPSG